VEVLKKHFDTALESPEGIKKLRELILTLAMQGKLVPQDPKDPSASELLKEIQAEKEKLIAEGKIKKQKELPEIKPEEVPYDVPEGWVWCRFFKINVVKSELVLSKDFPNEKQIGPDSIEKNSGKLLFTRTVAEFGSTGPNNRFYKGQLLYSKIRPSLNKAIIAPYDGLCSADMYPIETSIDIKFMLKIILSEIFLSQVRLAENRIKMPKLNLESLGLFIIPLPPLAEQKRIVAKIDELMALCNKLEERRANRDQKRMAVHTSAITRLLTAAGKKEFDTSWQFITRHFDPIYSVKENVAELKKAILTLAMQGKLVPQDPKDPPASELLKEIQAEKEKLIAEGKIKKQKELPGIKPKEVPYEVPEGWVWCRLGIAADISMGQSPDGKSYNEIGNGVPLVNGPVEFGGRGPFDSTVATKFTTSPTKMCKKGDLLLCVRGSTTGRTNIAGFNSCIGRGVASIKSFIYPQFLNQFVLTLRHRWIEISTGSTFPNISQEKIQNYLIPLPPLAEQKRIVTKIDELMALCDKLESQIDQATQKQTALFNAVLAKVSTKCV